MKKKDVFKKSLTALSVGALIGVACVGVAETQEPAHQAAADSIVESIPDVTLRLLIDEVVERNPRLAKLRAEAAAVEQHAPQVKALPNPTATLTATSNPGRS